MNECCNLQGEFEIGYSTYARQDESTATQINLIAPALTPSSGNPAFRILEIDPDSYALMDFIEIIANVTEPGYQKKPNWIPYYSAREVYGKLLFDRPLAPQEPLNAGFWHRVTEVFAADDGAFQDFMRRRTRGAIKPRCKSSFCKDRWIVALRAARSEYNGQVFTYRKRSLPGSLVEEEEHEDHPGDHSCSSRIEDTSNILRTIQNEAGAIPVCHALVLKLASLCVTQLIQKTWQVYQSRSKHRWLRFLPRQLRDKI